MTCNLSAKQSKQARVLRATNYIEDKMYHCNELVAEFTFNSL